MATKRKIYLPSINGITASTGAGAEGLVDLPLYYRYHAIGFEFVDGHGTPGTTEPTDILALLGDIALKINTDVKRIHTAAELNHLNALNGTEYARKQIGNTTAKKQVLKMFFAEPWRKSVAQADAMAASLTPENGVNSAQISIKLAAAMPSTGSLRLFAIVDAPLAKPQNGYQLCKHVTRTSANVGGTSSDVQTLDRSGFYQVISMKNPTGAVIGKATVTLNGTVIHELDREANIAHLQDLGLNPSDSKAPETGSGDAGYGYDLVLDDDDPILSALPADGQDLQLRLDFVSSTASSDASASASGVVPLLIERLKYGWN